MEDQFHSSARRQFITAEHLWYILPITLAIIAGITTLFIDATFIIGAIVGIVMFLVIVKYEFFGLIIYMIVFLARPGETYPALAAVRVEFVLGGFLAALTILKNGYLRGRIVLPYSRLNTDFLLLVGIICLSFIFSSCKTCTVDAIMDIIKLGVFYLLIILQVNTKRRVELFVWFFVLVVALLTFDVTWGFFHGEARFNQGMQRATSNNSALDNFNGIAITMNTLIPFAYYLFFHYRDIFRKVLMGAVLALFVLTLILTGSRGGLIGFLAVCGFIWWQSKKKLALSIVFLVFLVAGWFSLGDASKERYLTILDSVEGKADASSQGRIDAWIDGIYLWVGRPITGVGAGAFAIARWEEFGRYLQPHNLYVQVLSELGALGFFIYFILIRNIFRTCKGVVARVRNKDPSIGPMEPMANAIMLSCGSLLVTGMFAHSAYRFTWFILAALAVVIFDVTKRIVPDSELEMLSTNDQDNEQKLQTMENTGEETS